jgi:hypothetical protein
MENNKVQEIYNRLTTDQAFAEELKKFEEGKEITTPEESAAAFIEFAKLQGYDVTVDELKAFAENQSKALSEEDLDSVNAAGIATWIAKAIVTNKPTGVCLGVGLGWGLAEGVGVTDCKIIGQGSGFGWKEGDHEAHEKRIERIFRAHNAAGLLLPKN